MTYPVWTTTAGKLASINEREFYQKSLVAGIPGHDAMPGFDVPTTIKFTKIAGELPPGLELSPKGILQGVPFEVATRKIFRFCCRCVRMSLIKEGKCFFCKHNFYVTGITPRTKKLEKAH